MGFKFEKGKEEIIKSLISKIQKDAAVQTEPCIEFARQFFSNVAFEDLVVWDISNLYAAFKHFWLFLQTRHPNETKIHIYNPFHGEHGWQSHYTVIEVLLPDMPFLVDSIRMVIERMGISAHLIIHMSGACIERDETHHLMTMHTRDKFSTHPHFIEAPIWVQIDRQTDSEIIKELQAHLSQALEDNRVAVEDWLPMRQKIKEVIDELDHSKGVSDDLLRETKAFLTWIEDHHFTFLGMCDYRIEQKDKSLQLEAIPNTGLGILRDTHLAAHHEVLHTLMPESCELASLSGTLIMSKTNWLSTVHRNVYSDYIGIKRFNERGEIIGERRVIGLYTSAAYNTSPRQIPFLRHKVSQVMINSGLNPKSHAGKVLLNIIETIPRDDLIQASEDELLELAMGIFHLHERKKIRLFARKDVYGRFISCLVYVPKERFNSELRQTMQAVLADNFQSNHITFSTYFTESVLARIHFVVRIDPTREQNWDLEDIERQLIEVGRSWLDDLLQNLLKMYDEEQAVEIYERYKTAFPSAYRDSYHPKMAVYDIVQLESLVHDKPLLIHFYSDPDGVENHFRLKVFQHLVTIPLSEILPIVERLGMQAISERPYQLTLPEGNTVWITDFTLVYTQNLSFKIEDVQRRFEQAFLKIWLKEVENDNFNQLILAAGLDWREVSILRAYAKYFKQIGFTFSQEYIELAMLRHAFIAKRCVDLFDVRFNPERFAHKKERLSLIETVTEDILKELDSVSNLDEDKIIRQYVSTINATLRTNYYQINESGESKAAISFKLNCQKIPGLPKPLPMFEIYVYSPRVEGVHLRGGKVARGGLRWSDRREDFRTEVLGLMKAQQVKNAIIVPTGAKGGFIPKYLSSMHTREEAFSEAVASYRIFIRSLLDITDNYSSEKIMKPKQVVSYDEDDPYLVVAADKGTATFSDYANEIALEYGFWLGDAFASGGSVGYDHKKMGITARGAWESVKRHFYEMNVDLTTTAFTVVGIGDMSGDVFGNGMLLSDRIKLLGAFNHQHIFIDPEPDPFISFKERERLFNLPRSGWMDYDHSLISKGGGVFERSAKSIPVSKEMKAAFDIKKNDIEPNELIRCLLKANIDLLWSAGIGTFVKAEEESHLEVGDRTNDGIRVNANELKCKLVGEGGNLGFTQRARLQYNLQGGLIYTDFIDNSAGVSCSDKEVNIKILLDRLIAEKVLTAPQRNALLSSMTDEVSQLVLSDNIAQTRAISLSASQANAIDLHIRYVNALEQSGKLDRHLEFIPDDKVLLERKAEGKGLGLPNICVLQSYSKMLLKEALLKTDVPEEPFLEKMLLQSFPQTLQRSYQDKIKLHPLRREIITTKLSNIVVNEMGFSFIFRMQDETNAPVASVVRAYLIARTILNLEVILDNIASLKHLKAEHEKTILTLYLRLVRRMTRWVLHTIPGMSIDEAVERYSSGIQELKQDFFEILSPSSKENYTNLMQSYIEWNLPNELAYELMMTRPLFSALDLIEVSRNSGRVVKDVARAYFEMGECLGISEIRSQVIAHPTESYWDSFSREAIRDDLDAEQRYITEHILKCQSDGENHDDCVASWLAAHKDALDKWHAVLAMFRSSSQLNYTMFFVIVKQLKKLTQCVDRRV